jgi:hypothetical protein
MLNGPDGTPSSTRTVFLYGCLVCIGKLAFSGLITKWFQIPQFAGSDFGMAIAALGAVYSLDKHVVNMAAANKKDEG